ncbi:MAG: hypothetical protein NW205_09855 [Hyphomicrobiaceae bacterium]|nr:hypothetical protein [Hyphomicrobiaceae bacterium]
MTTVPLEQAQAELPELVSRAVAGEEIVISAGDRLVKLAVEAKAPVFDEDTARRRGWGMFKGQFEVGPEFFDPLPESELDLWHGGSAK